MGWKKWSYWLKGGIIGIIVFIILLVLSAIFPSYGLGNIFQWIIVFIGSIIMVPARSLFSFKLGPPITNFYVPMIVLFILGAIIGWIYGKIKQGKEVK